MMELAGLLIAVMLGGALVMVAFAIIIATYTLVRIKKQGWKNPYRKGN